MWSSDRIVSRLEGRATLPRTGWILVLGLILLPSGTCLAQGSSDRRAIAAKLRLDRAVAEADRLDPGWRLKDIEARNDRVPPGKDSAAVLDATRARLSPPSKSESEALNAAFDTKPGQPLEPAVEGELKRFVDRNREVLPALRGLA